MQEGLIPEEGTFYAQLDSKFTTQDYRPYFRCVRLIGVLEESFTDNAFNKPKGCPTFVIDLAWNGFSKLRNRRFKRLISELNWLEGAFAEDSLIWVKIKFFRSLRVTEDYVYEAFTTSVPEYLQVTAINLVEGPNVDAPEAAPDVQPSAADRLVNDVTLTGFHVGQGMSSLLSSPSHNHGYLLDAGGGTPVLRESYRTGQHFGGVFKNDLALAIKHLQRVTVVLSHSDCDHWRILDWDLQLLAKVDRIFLPIGRPALVFNSHRVKIKTKGLDDAKFWLGNVELDVLRSEPRRNDETGHCLIVHAKQDKRSALLPGDYVYSRILQDKRSDGAIVALGNLKFDAIVVPHHGDEASAMKVFSPRVDDQSIAFFSAGDHEGYGHPTLLSIDAHFLKKFAVVDLLSPNIVACTLLA